MHCDDILPLVEKLADGECTELERARAEAHVETCESCREHFRFIRALPEAARKAPLPEPPGAYWDVLPRKIMARIERQRSTKESRRWLSQILTPPHLRWVGALAAGMIVVVLSYEVLKLEEETPPVTAPAAVPVGEDALPAEPSKAAPEVVAEGPAEPTDSSEAPLQEPRSLPLAEEVRPAPARARRESVEKEDVPKTPETVPSALDAAGRGQPPTETGQATVGVVAEEGREPEFARAPSAAPPMPSLKASEPMSRGSTKAELEAREKEQLDNFGMMKQSAREPKGVSPVAFSEPDRETTSVSGAELEANCRALRDSVDASVEVAKREDIRYRLAKCSIELFRLRRTEDVRQVAEEDASAYLEIFPEGEHADEIRELLEQINKQ